VGASKDAIRPLVKAYQKRGEAGLRNGVVPARSRRKLPGPVRKKIVEIKKHEPLFGVKRISHLLKRAFFLSASPETVRQTLKEESLLVPSRKKHRRNITRPGFLSDQRRINCGNRISLPSPGGPVRLFDRVYRRLFKVCGGVELYRSQTADQVLEVYRRALGEYGVAKEVLTDQGRQYTTWRGSTRFERELKKDRVSHIKSQPIIR